MEKIRKSYRLSPAVVAAMHILQKKGYAFPSSTETGVVEQAIKDAWEKEYPGEQFPADGGEEVEPKKESDKK